MFGWRRGCGDRHVFSLAKTYRQMLVLNEKQVKGSAGDVAGAVAGSGGPFAADALIAQARRYRDRADLTRGLRWIARRMWSAVEPAGQKLVLERLVMRLSSKAGLGGGLAAE